MAVPPSLRSLYGALLLAMLFALLSPVAPARATSSYLCTGYVSCAESGHPHFGYKRAGSQMWWRMYSGHNCTNYVAYRLVKRGMSEERPWDGTGMAYNWGRANRGITDDKPMVGSVAWWNAGDGVGSSGHVAYVQRVVTRRKIVISEDSWGGDFHWRVVTKASGRWPTGFVHFMDEQVEMVTAPSIVGEPRVGETLTAQLGEWRRATSYAVQWFAGSTPIAGATTTTLTPTPDMVRRRLSVRVTATARGYVPGTATSPRTTRVARGLLAVDVAPTLTGAPRVDEVLTVTPGTVSPPAQSTTIRWFADGTRIDGASGTRLRLGQDRIGQRIHAVVVSSREGYRNLRVPTEPTPAVQAGRFEITEPFALTGSPRLGQPLTVEPGTYTPADADVTHAWLRDGEPIAGATAPSYVAELADVGHRLSVRIDLRRTGYRSTSVTLAAETLVMTRPDLRLRVRGLVRKAVVRLRVVAPGVEDPGGWASVRLGRRNVQRGQVVDGRLRVVFRDVRAGDRPIRVRYEGTDVVLPARARTTVRVMAP